MNFTHAGHKLATAPSYHATVYKPPRKETKRSTEREFNTSFIYYLLDEVIWYTMCRFLCIILTDCCFGHRRPLTHTHTHTHTHTTQPTHTQPTHTTTHTTTQPHTHTHTHGGFSLPHFLFTSAALFFSGQVRSGQFNGGGHVNASAVLCAAADCLQRTPSLSHSHDR